MIDLQEVVRNALFGTPVKSTVKRSHCKCCYNDFPIDHLNHDGLCPECRKKDVTKCICCGDFVETDTLYDDVCEECCAGHDPEERYCTHCHKWIEDGFQGEVCDDCNKYSIDPMDLVKWEMA